MEASIERRESLLKVKMSAIGWMDTKQGREISVRGSDWTEGKQCVSGWLSSASLDPGHTLTMFSSAPAN